MTSRAPSPVSDTVPDPAAPAGSHGRAGRDLWAATAIGLVLGLGLVLLPILVLPAAFAVIVSIALVIAVLELEAALVHRDVTVVHWPVRIGVAAMPVVGYWWGALPLLAVAGATVLAILADRLRGGPDGYVTDVAASVLVAAYTGLMGGFVGLMLASSQGGDRVLTFIILTICSDIGGYAAGVLFGKHPIAPSISPKKSWEGLAGSFLVQAVAGVLLFVLLLDARWWQGLVTGLVMTVTATLGDFVESAVKRDLGVKDMGTLLPGHGGLMDRLDSLLPNAFVSWALFSLFLGA